VGLPVLSYVWLCNARQAASHIKDKSCCFWITFLLFCELYVRGIFSLLAFVNIISVCVTGHWCVLSWFSHPRGTLASRSWAAQTANGVISVRAPGLTPSAAPVLDGSAAPVDSLIEHIIIIIIIFIIALS
jgi:hypothetical protein